jgi:hypothetical protein
MLFALPFSFFPIVAYYLMRTAEGLYPTIPDLATDGGVLTIAISLAAEALSRLIASGKKWREVKLVAAASSAWVIVCGSMFYALRYAHRPTNSVFVVRLCILLIVVGLTNATFCRFLPEED